jgi:hypothetical protein
LTDDQLPVWQPGGDVPKWAAKLQEDFPPDQVGFLPQVWCKACSDAVKKGTGAACGQGDGDRKHVKKKCEDCGNNITTAHFHTSYVGHAHITRRLLDVDPRWSWEPMGRDIPDDVMVAAIQAAATLGNPGLIDLVLQAYPPKLVKLDDGSHVLWGRLIIHDENGEEHVMPGVGDAVGKAWGPKALKEVIGDMLRNAGMREGMGLRMWMKENAEQVKRERDQAPADDPRGYAARAGLFDEGSQDPPASRTRGPKTKTRETPPDTGAQAGINPEAQAAADLAWKLRQKEGMTPAEFRAKVYEPARKDQLLGLHCMAPWDKTEETTVLKVMARCREELESDQDA